MMVNRFGKCTAEEWADPVIDQKKVDKQYRKRKNQPIMFPSSHDITRRNRAECLIVLKKLIEAGNQVLIVSKPSVCCITLLCNFFKDYKDQIMFRFTIGSVNDDVLSFWEPNAPSFNERLNCLKYAYEHGYQTSVSCEPYLDSPVFVYEDCKPYITDSFWIGKMNNFNTVVDTSEYRKYILPLVHRRKSSYIEYLYKQLKGEKKVKFKDSIRKVIDGQK
jgi:DNA repair photolyase